MHPIARVVFFQDGIGQYPVPEEIITNRLDVAEDSCRKGFKEIQFDYIRFRDYRNIKNLTIEDKYSIIENIIKKARVRLEKYNIKIAVDIFGRIPLNKDDMIGQKMEVFDRVADIICPMAYPSHYSWSNKFMSDPYYTVFLTSTSAKDRVRNAEIVTYIQAFTMKISKSKFTFEGYIKEQLRAVHDAGIRGFILWNASQEYDIPFKVLDNFYNQETNEAQNIQIQNKKT